METPSSQVGALPPLSFLLGAVLPDVSTHTPTLAECAHYLERGGHAVGESMFASASKLARVGADFVICPDHTTQEVCSYVQPRSQVPWLHVAEVVADEASERGYRRVGLIGKRWLVGSDVYPHVLASRGIQCITPDAVESDKISRIIMDELVCGIFKQARVVYLQAVIARLKEQGCDAVILGCTELSLVVDDGNSPLPTLNSTRLLARAALRRATMW
jgi:aspartate racemase